MKRAAAATALALAIAGCAGHRTGMTLGDQQTSEARIEHMSENPRLVLELEPMDDRTPFARHRLVVTNASDVAIGVERAALVADLGATVVPVLVYPVAGAGPDEGLVGPGERSVFVAEVAEGTGLPSAGPGVFRLHFRYLPLDREEFADVPVAFLAGREE